MTDVPVVPTTFRLARDVVGVFTTRATGNLAHRRPHAPAQLHRSRSALAEALGVEVGDLHHMHQVHGGQVAVVDDATPQGAELRGVDGLVTSEPGRALVVQAADCVPVLFAVDGGPVGVAHAGRGGVAADVVAQVIDHLVHLGADPTAIHAAIGPAIGGCCYEVPERLAQDVAASVDAPGDVGVVATTTWGTTSLDLPAAVAWQLRRAGVVDVRDWPGCTRCDGGGRWFSHRADPSTGRHAGAVVLRGAPAQRSAA